LTVSSIHDKLYNNKEIKLHTPSAPQVQEPASATDPRYSTSGILNAQLKEKNRQGLLSTLGGRTGQGFDVNKFVDIKAEARDSRAIPVLEQLSKMYADVAQKSKAKGVINDTHSKGKAEKNINAYNQSVDAVNNYLKQYGVENSNVVKVGGMHNYDKRALHDDDYAAKNRDEIKKSVDSLGNSGQTFNDVEQQVKKQNTAKKK
jgi:hypothetical protein